MDTAFKILFPNAAYRVLKVVHEMLVDKELNNLRAYKLGENYRNKIQRISMIPELDVMEQLLLWCEQEAHIKMLGGSHRKGDSKCHEKWNVLLLWIFIRRDVEAEFVLFAQKYKA